MNAQEDDQLLTTEEAAALIGVSPRTLMRWAKGDEPKIQSYPTRRAVTEARPGIGWRRSEVLKVAGKPDNV